MQRTFLKLLFVLGLLPLAARAGDSIFNGRWRMDVARSTALDGWTTADLIISTEGNEIFFRYEMTWHATKVTAENEVKTNTAIEHPNFFRIDQRHMAVYARPKEATQVERAVFLDSGHTLRIEAQVPVETSQGNTTMRIYQEYRLLEGGNDLVLIELHSSRDRPLTYYFTRVPTEAAKN